MKVSGVWVVLINYHGLDDTLECLDSIRDSDLQLNQVVVVDNASALGQADTIETQFPQVSLIRNSENQGWSGGNNRGIEFAMAAGADAILLLNNDTIVSPDLGDRIVGALNDGWDIVGPVINEYIERDKPQTEAVLFNRKRSAAFFVHVPVLQTTVNDVAVVASDIVNGCAVCIRREVFAKIGLIDEQFFLICEESDFCLRAAEADFQVGVIAKAMVFHKHSVSFARAGKPLQRYYSVRNLALLLSRHHGGSSRLEPPRRGRVMSQFAHIRHAFHLYCHERELNNPAGAAAVAQGVTDAWTWRFGQREIQPTLPSRLLDTCWLATWRMRGGRVVHRGSEQVADQ